MNWAWSQKLPPTSKLILMAIADSASDAGESWMSNSSTATRCCVSTRTVQREITKFASMGLLTVEPRYTSAGRQTSNICRVNFDVIYPHDILSPSERMVLNKDDKLSGTGMTLDVTVGDDTIMSPLEPTKDPSYEPQQQEIESSPLHFPKALSNTHRAAIHAMLEDVPITQCQPLLDELAASLETNTIKTDALRWFGALVRRHKMGTFVPLGGIRIADRRLKQHVCNTETQQVLGRGTDKELARGHLMKIAELLRK